MAELEKIVGLLEKGEVKLEDSITLYERGAKLKARCESLLKDAEARIEKIMGLNFVRYAEAVWGA